MEPPEIERLDERTIQRIAAGEVVERPASVVKELVENSLDAGASRIAVSVEAGGTDGIRVRDDGVGIPEDQLEAAVAEHATSKIGDIDDLDAGVGTLGFRGEALYTIGGVSRLTVRSKATSADASGAADSAGGAEITVEGGSIGDVRPAGCPAGTVVEIDDLFYNTPARRKFLKRVATEFDHVNTVVTSYALANPDVAVSLEHDGRETFATEGNGDLRSAVLAVYGREVAESMIEVDWRPDPTDGNAAVPRVTGLVSHPETTRSSRDYLGTYVNDRYVTTSVLREAILDAYDGQLAPDRYPFTVLFVEVPPDDVDVNVHPRKLEVRFDEEAAVRSVVKDAVESALLDHGLIRSTAPRGRSAPDEVTVDPEAPDAEAVGGAGAGGDPSDVRSDAPSDDADESTDVSDPPGSPIRLDPDDPDAWAVEGIDADSAIHDAEDKGSGDAHPVGSDDAESVESDDLDPPGRDAPDATVSTESRVDTTDASDSEPLDSAGDTADRPSPRSWQSDPDRPTREDSMSIDSRPDRESAESRSERGSDGSDPGNSRSDGPRSDTPISPRPGTPISTSQRTLAGNETTDEREYDSLPRLRVLGQLHETYVIAEAPDGIVLIDQHAADERVNYERLKRDFADGAPAQALAEPVIVELTAREAALFDEFIEALSGIGFRAKRAGDREVVVEAVPAVFDAALDPELLRDALSSFVSDAAAGDASDDTDASGGTGPGPVTTVVDDLLADLACYPSVTGNTSLTEGSVVDLLDRLDDCENPYACPHGRPVVIRLDHEEIGSRFERDYPGHAGRRAE